MAQVSFQQAISDPSNSACLMTMKLLRHLQTHDLSPDYCTACDIHFPLQGRAAVSLVSLNKLLAAATFNMQHSTRNVNLSFS